MLGFRSSPRCRGSVPPVEQGVEHVGVLGTGRGMDGVWMWGMDGVWMGCGWGMDGVWMGCGWGGQERVGVS